VLAHLVLVDGAAAEQLFAGGGDEVEQAHDSPSLWLSVSGSRPLGTAAPRGDRRR
jgi:hypothetical protein